MLKKLSANKRALLISASLVVIFISLAMGLHRKEIPVGIEDVLANKPETVLVFNPNFLFAGVAMLAFAALSAKGYSVLAGLYNSNKNEFRPRQVAVMDMPQKTEVIDFEIGNLHKVLEMEQQRRELSKKAVEVSEAAKYLHDQEKEIKVQVKECEKVIHGYLKEAEPIKTSPIVSKMEKLILAPQPEAAKIPDAPPQKKLKKAASKAVLAKGAAKAKPTIRRKKTK